MHDLENMEVVRDYNVIAIEINTIKAQTNKVLLNSAIEIGKRLKEAKDMVGHGNWGKWLNLEVSYSQRTASNLMKIYDEYSMKIVDKSNWQLTSDLGYTQAISMLVLDFDERENFLLEHDVKDMSVKELDEAIKEKQKILKEKESLEEKLLSLNGSNDDLAAKLTKKMNSIKEFEEKQKNNLKEIKSLKTQLENVSPGPDDSEELEILQSEIDKKKSEIQILKNKLTLKPEKIETKQISYEMPEHIKNEIEEMRVKLNSTENSIKFKTTFKLLMDNFNILIEILDDIKLNESEEYEKYKGAINKLLNKLLITD